MTERERYDRAAFALGVTALVSVVFVLADGKFRFVTVRDWAILVLLALAAAGLVAGWRSLPRLSALAGVLSLAAAVVQVLLVAVGSNWLGGSINTAALWLGLGVGFLVVSLAPRVAPDASRPNP